MPVAATPMKEDFAALLEETFNTDQVMEGAVIKGTVVAIVKDLAVIDVGQDRGPRPAQGIHSTRPRA